MATTPLQQSFQLFDDVTDKVLTAYKNGLKHNFDDDVNEPTTDEYIGYVLLCQLKHLSPDQPNNITDEEKFDYSNPDDPDDPNDDNLVEFLAFIDRSFHGQKIYQVPRPLFKSYNVQVKETLGTNWLTWAGPAPIYYEQENDSYFTVLPTLTPANFKATLNQYLFAGTPYSTKAIDTALPELDA